MQKIKATITFVVIISTVLYFRCQTYAQVKQRRELANDIRIMETVLDQIVAPERGRMRIFNSNTRGYYLKNYGIIFSVDLSLYNRGIFSINVKRRGRNADENQFVVFDEKEETVRENFTREVVKLKKSLAKFLSEWTSAITTLNPDEKVTIIANLNDFPATLRSIYGNSIHQLIASVSVRDIRNYRKGKISRDGFDRKIIFDEVTSVDEDISILENVIQTSLRHSARKTGLGLAGDVRGVYFKGYGVVFFTDISVGSDNYVRMLSFLSERLKEEGKRSVAMKKLSEKSRSTGEEVKKIETKLIDLVANYGHNLKTLQPNEWVEIAINFKGVPIDGEYSKSILKVRKRMIDNYMKEKIKFEQFKKAVNVIYY